MFSLEIKGLDEFEKAMNGLTDDIDDELEQSLLNASQPMLNELEQNAKRVDEKVSSVSSQKNSSGAEVVITLESESLIFKEYGTPQVQATPFIRPTLDSNSDSTVENFAIEINKQIDEISK